MDHPSLEYFVEIARQLNISKAAASLHISQQSLSAYIQKLEKHYGVMLLNRKPKLKLTPAGERVLLAAEEIERIYQDLARDMTSLENDADIRISLGIFEPLVSLVMQNLPIIEIGKKYPNVSFHITTGYNVDILERIQRCELDLAVAGYTGMEENSLEELEAIPLSRDEDCIIITEEVMRLYFADEYEKYVEKFSEGVDILDLSHVPIVMHPMESGVSKKIRKYFMDHHRTFKVFGEGPSQDVVNSMVLKNKAFGMCNGTASRMLVEGTEKKVHVFPLKSPKLEREIVLLYPKKRKKNAFLSDIAGMIAENWRRSMKVPSAGEEGQEED